MGHEREHSCTGCGSYAATMGHDPECVYGEIDRLRSALRWYAAPTSWMTWLHRPAETSEAAKDRGDRARAALSGSQDGQ